MVSQNNRHILQIKIIIYIDIASIIEPEEVPKMYCATGKTKCNDLYFHEECQCPKCPIWEENNLASGEPMNYFCKDGEAK
jgi:hypothetical protein